MSFGYDINDDCPNRSDGVDIYRSDFTKTLLHVPIMHILNVMKLILDGNNFLVIIVNLFPTQRMKNSCSKGSSSNNSIS